MRPLLRFLLLLLLLLTGALTPVAQAQPTYFPPRLYTQPWATVTPASLGWNQVALDSVLAYVGRTHGRSFIILQNGRIAVEQ